MNARRRGGRYQGRIQPGRPFPLGATYDGAGVNFSVFTEVADRVELCLFDERGRESRVDVPEVTACCWHVHLPEIEPGQRYGWRVHGPWRPEDGLRCNSAKLLLDPYARAIDGDVDWDEAVFGHRFDDPQRRNDSDSARFVPKSVVTSPFFDWGHDRPPQTPWSDTVLYELHVKGFTAVHPAVSTDLRGTYAGLAHPAAIEHLLRLGITAVELMPVQHFVHETHLLEGGLRNYWGYNSIGFFAPYHGYAARAGNTLNMRHPHVLQLLMDSLRYWVLEMHVDGFRFSLAAALARELHDVERLAALFDLIQQDPVVSRVKLIAEPWDVGEGGYQVGNFPPLWSERNGKYRDCVRDYWRSTDCTLGELAHRFTGSADLYGTNGRRPYASVNFVTCHDGFTLTDLVSYGDKHNEANGEEDRDGVARDRSWNCGAEGPTEDTDIVTLRARQRRNFLATLLLSQGIPMLLAGDELGRTQSGNNNAYCQDNKLSWIDWENVDGDLLDFTRALVRLRRDHPVFRRRRGSHGRAIDGSGGSDIAWFKPSGESMIDADWREGFAKSLGVFLNGGAIAMLDERGDRIEDDNLILLFNAHWEPLEFRLPPFAQHDHRWVQLFDTMDARMRREPPQFGPGWRLLVEGRALVVLRGATA